MTNVCLTGSGWPEVPPPCHYEFYFDGANVAPDQPDNAPPNTSFLVPADAAAGPHTVRVELKVDESGQLVKTKEAPFKVVSESPNPWKVKPHQSGLIQNGLDIAFDPTDVCDVSPCDKIVLIQVVKIVGTGSDGSTRDLKPSDFKNNPHADDYDRNTTAAGYGVDYTFGDKDPYYNGDDPGDEVGQGKQGATPEPSQMSDDPGTYEPNWPPGTTKVTLIYEVAAFCAAGENAGEFLGTMTWKYEKEAGKAPTSTPQPGTRDQPSDNFRDALDEWNRNNGFDDNFPQMKPPPCQ